MKLSRFMLAMILSFFICTLYGLYKYVAIDVDYIFSQNHFVDYSIDVSHLRGANRSSSSGLQQWDEVVTKANGIHIAYITDKCENPSKVLGVGYLVKRRGGSLQAVVQLNYTSDEEISEKEGEALVFVRFGNLALMNQTMSVCDLDRDVVNCPIPKGTRSYIRRQQLPKYAPRGNYRAHVVVRQKRTKEVKICVKGQLRI